MGAAESFDGASTNQEPPRAFPMFSIDNICSMVVTAPVPPASQMALSSLAARPRSSLARAGSLTETKLTANASRRLQRPPTRQESYDSSEYSSELEKRIVDRPATASSVGVAAENGAIHPDAIVYLLITFNYQCQVLLALHLGSVEIAIITTVPHTR
jgi:hypothetical protein